MPRPEVAAWADTAALRALVRRAPLAATLWSTRRARAAVFARLRAAHGTPAASEARAVVAAEAAAAASQRLACALVRYSDGVGAFPRAVVREVLSLIDGPRTTGRVRVSFARAAVLAALHEVFAGVKGGRGVKGVVAEAMGWFEDGGPADPADMEEEEVEEEEGDSEAEYVALRKVMVEWEKGKKILFKMARLLREERGVVKAASFMSKYEKLHPVAELAEELRRCASLLDRKLQSLPSDDDGDEDEEVEEEIEEEEDGDDGEDGDDLEDGDVGAEPAVKGSRNDRAGASILRRGGAEEGRADDYAEGNRISGSGKKARKLAGGERRGKGLRKRSAVPSQILEDLDAVDENAFSGTEDCAEDEAGDDDDDDEGCRGDGVKSGPGGGSDVWKIAARRLRRRPNADQISQEPVRENGTRGTRCTHSPARRRPRQHDRNHSREDANEDQIGPVEADMDDDEDGDEVLEEDARLNEEAIDAGDEDDEGHVGIVGDENEGSSAGLRTPQKRKRSRYTPRDDAKQASPMTVSPLELENDSDDDGDSRKPRYQGRAMKKRHKLSVTLSPLYSPEEGNFGLRSKQIGRRRARKKGGFTEQETSQLLAGLKKHGWGEWTLILKAFEWDYPRTAVNLKDRARTLNLPRVRYPPPLIRDPNAVRRRGRPAGSVNPTRSKVTRRSPRRLSQQSGEHIDDSESSFDGSGDTERGGGRGSGMGDEDEKDKEEGSNGDDDDRKGDEDRKELVEEEAQGSVGVNGEEGDDDDE